MKTNNHSSSGRKMPPYHEEKGAVKFHCLLDKGSAGISINTFSLINSFRDQLYHRGFIGVYPDGTGYGNISIRNKAYRETFYITGTATGKYRSLTDKQYVLVNGYDITANRVWCTGLLCASSESMTHAVIYETLPEINSVIHIHSLPMWQQCKGRLSETPGDVFYGTPAMAKALKKVIKECPDARIIRMAGHRAGLVAFGNSLEEAFHQIIINIPE
jgi:ribulose-5-phosphate 4-epimerase/fuculose-1-phosphate aldolase